MLSEDLRTQRQAAWTCRIYGGWRALRNCRIILKTPGDVRKSPCSRKTITLILIYLFRQKLCNSQTPPCAIHQTYPCKLAPRRIIAEPSTVRRDLVSIYSQIVFYSLVLLAPTPIYLFNGWWREFIDIEMENNRLFHREPTPSAHQMMASRCKLLK